MICSNHFALIDFFVFRVNSSSDDDVSLSLAAFDDFALVDFAAETARFLTARLRVADFPRVFLTLVALALGEADDDRRGVAFFS